MDARGAPRFVHRWPGEHYRLLRALVADLQPLVVIDIGTFTGRSAVAIAEGLQPGAKLITYDIRDWRGLPNSCLRDEDFRSGRIRQILGDLAEPEIFRQNAELLCTADFFFVDGPKDGVFEPRLLQNLATIRLKTGVVIMFDDIRLWNMLGVWRAISRPKLDFTSFGHYTGTGLVDWEGVPAD